MVANTCVGVIRNLFVEVSHTKRKSALVGFHRDLSKEPIFIVDYTTTTELPNDTDIYHMNKIPLLNGCNNYLLSKAQACYFGMI